MAERSTATIARVWPGQFGAWQARMLVAPAGVYIVNGRQTAMYVRGAG